MAKFEPALQLVLQHEGGLEINASDSAGITNYGISLRFFKKRVKPDATEQDIRNLTVNDAAQLFERFFWDRQPFSDINSQKIANRVFDLHVNSGQGVSLLQKAVNACTGLHLVVDDMLGMKTIDATNALPEEDLYSHLIEQAQAYYASIVANNPKDAVFLKGWLARLNG